MIAPRKSYAGQVLGWALALILSRLVWPVADTTVQDFWKDKGEPYLKAHALGWAIAMIDWLGPFWSGVGLTLLVMFAVEMGLAWRRSRTQNNAEPVIASADVIELGRECIAVADDTFRTQQQIEDGAPRQVHPPGGYKSNDEWSRAHADFGRELQAYGRRTMMQRDRSHGADLVDVLLRLQELGLTIPVFADGVPSATSEMIAVMLPYYLPAYARFVGAMGRILKRGDLPAAIAASKAYRPTLEGPPAAGIANQAPAASSPPMPPKRHLIDGSLRPIRGNEEGLIYGLYAKASRATDSLMVFVETDITNLKRRKIAKYGRLSKDEALTIPVMSWARPVGRWGTRAWFGDSENDGTDLAHMIATDNNERFAIVLSYSDGFEERTYFDFEWTDVGDDRRPVIQSEERFKFVEYWEAKRSA